MNAQPPVIPLDRIPPNQLRVWLKGYRGDWRDNTEERRGSPPPPIQKPYPQDSRLIDLADPESFTVGHTDFLSLVRGRESKRVYTDEPLSNEELSFLLWCTQGVTEVVPDAHGHVDHHLRTVPSAGARHPFETYLLVKHVAGLKPGIYRFLPLEHKLLALYITDRLVSDLVTACYGQTFVEQAAVVVVWCAIPSRMEWRYTYLSHRIIAMEAGHVCQNLYLASPCIGAGACAILGYDQYSLDELLGVDGDEEFTVYLASVGKTAETGEA